MLLYEVWVQTNSTYVGDYYLVLCNTKDIEIGRRMAITHCQKHHNQLPDKVIFRGREEE